MITKIDLETGWNVACKCFICKVSRQLVLKSTSFKTIWPSDVNKRISNFQMELRYVLVISTIIWRGENSIVSVKIRDYNGCTVSAMSFTKKKSTWRKIFSKSLFQNSPRVIQKWLHDKKWKQLYMRDKVTQNPRKNRMMKRPD